MTKRLGRALLVAWWLVALGCEVTGPGDQRLPGLVDPDDPSAVVVPDSVDADQAFEVTIHTVGGGCTQQGDTQVVIAAGVADVTPYDIYPIARPGIGCPGNVGSITHTAEVTFSMTGDAEVVVHARALGSEEPLDLSFDVVVR